MADNLIVLRQNEEKVEIPINDLSTREKVMVKEQLGTFTYDFLPHNAADNAQAMAADAMADAGFYTAVKTAATVAGGLLGGAPGAGLGFVLSSAASDGWNVFDKATSDNDEFWNEFKGNLGETIQEDSSFQDFLEGFSTGSSFIGRGGEEAIVNDWGNIVGQSGSSTVGSIMGTAAQYISGFAMAGSTNTMFATSSLYEGINETTRSTGMGDNFWSASARGIGLAAAFYGSGTISAKVLPKAVNMFAKKNINTGVTSALSNTTRGFDTAIAVEADKAALAGMRGDMSYSYDPMVSMLAFGFGSAMGGMSSLSKASKYVKNKVRFRSRKKALIKDVMEMGDRNITHKEAKGVVNDIVRDTKVQRNNVVSRLSKVEQPYRKRIAKDYLTGKLNLAGKNSEYNQKVVLDLIDDQNYGGSLKSMSRAIQSDARSAIKANPDTDILDNFSMSKQARKEAVEWAKEQDQPTEALRSVLNRAQKGLRGKNDRIGVAELRRELQ